MSTGSLRMVVVGHVEWVRFARVERVPGAGEVAHASDDFEEPAGGGAVAAVQLARLAGEATLITSLGEDEHGRAAVARLNDLGVDVRASLAEEPTRSAVTLVDAGGERTITTFGRRLEPSGEDGEELWEGLRGADAVYFTAGDEGALRRAREGARVLVASPRARHALGHGVALDALVYSASDALESAQAARVGAEAELLVRTEGGRGGAYGLRGDGAREGRFEAAALPGERVDSYGCGDSFAAALTYGLAAGAGLGDALGLAARCGAECLCRRGPYGRPREAAG